MKKVTLLSILFLFLSFGVSMAQVDTESQEEISSDWSGGFEAAVTNNYVWRGMPINEGVIAQPYAWVSYKNWTFSLWGSFTFSEKNDWDKWYEIDPVISYAFELGNFTIEPSFNYYYYIDQADCPNTGEIGLSIGYPMFDIITLGVAAYLDVIEYSGALYTEQSVKLENELSDAWALSAGLTLGSGLKKFNESYFGLSQSKVYLLTLDCRVTYSAPCGLYVQPYLQYNKTLDNDLEAYINNQSSIFGLIVGMEF